MTVSDSRKLNDTMSALKKSERRFSDMSRSVARASALLKRGKATLASAELQKCVREYGLEVLEKLEKGVEL